METRPLVRILMGSDSDLPVMKDAAAILEQLGVPFHLTVLSAHRTPDEVVAYVKKGDAEGCKVFIAGASGAAHLAGVVAAHTASPVIAVPILGKSLEGLDSLLSMVQMPPGVPVATVGINGAKNAGILATQIIGAGDAAVREKVAEHKRKLAQEVRAKAQALEEKGYQAYLAEKA